MPDVITPPMLDRFCTSAGPARLSMMTMVRGLLDDEAAAPDLRCGALRPLQRLLVQIRAGAAPLDDDCGLAHEYAISFNAALGFDSPAWVEGSRTHLEIDTLLTLSRAMGATMCGDGREILTPIGAGLLRSPQTLWRAAAWTLSVVSFPNKQIADMWELLLAWLLVDGDEFDAQFAALEEVAGDKRPPGFPEIFSIATCSLYTLARALNMFVPRPRHIMKKPRLNEFGRAVAIEALRGAVVFRWNQFDLRDAADYH
jgi:hypothetical protein